MHVGSEDLGLERGRGFQALMDADCLSLGLLTPCLTNTVGEQLLRLPSGVLTLAGSEPRLEAAQEAARAGARAREEGDYFAVEDVERRVVVRGLFHEDEIGLETVVLDTGAELWVPNYMGPPVTSFWGVLEFEAYGADDPLLIASLQWAIPDICDLTLPSYGEWLSSDFGDFLLNRWLLSTLDLSSCGLADPAKTMRFLKRAHSEEPFSLRPPAADDDWTFARHVEALMSASQGASTALTTGWIDIGQEVSRRSHLEEHPMPKERLIRNARDGELVAAEWLAWMGHLDACVTPVGPDSGIDVVSSDAVAQVKMESVPTSRHTVQALLGAAHAEGKYPYFFSLAGYTAQALSWADMAGVSLFAFDLQGVPTPVNDAARKRFTSRVSS